MQEDEEPYASGDEGSDLAMRDSRKRCFRPPALGERAPLPQMARECGEVATPLLPASSTPCLCDALAAELVMRVCRAAHITGAPSKGEASRPFRTSSGI